MGFAQNGLNAKGGQGVMAFKIGEPLALRICDIEEQFLGSIVRCVFKRGDTKLYPAKNQNPEYYRCKVVFGGKLMSLR